MPPSHGPPIREDARPVLAELDQVPGDVHSLVKGAVVGARAIARHPVELPPGGAASLPVRSMV